MPNLYEIASEVQSVLALTETEDGEIPAELAAHLDGLGMTIAQKTEHLCRAIRQAGADADAYKAEAQRLAALQKTAQDKADWIKEYLFKCLTLAGIDRLDTELFKLWIQSNGRPSITLKEGEPIPARFEKVTVTLDGTRAYEAWKSGEPLPPSLVVTLGKHLRIK